MSMWSRHDLGLLLILIISVPLVLVRWATVDGCSLTLSMTLNPSASTTRTILSVPVDVTIWERTDGGWRSPGAERRTRSVGQRVIQRRVS